MNIYPYKGCIQPSLKGKTIINRTYTLTEKTNIKTYTMDLIAIKKLGEELGHEGPELRNFVDRQVQLYEEQQNRERERQKEEREERLKNRELDVREK